MRLFKFLFALVFVAAVLGVAAIAGGWLWLQSEVAKPGPSLEEAVFEVEPGEHLGSVAQRLEEQGLISDERTLRLHARLEGQQTAIKVGEYAVPPRASAPRPFAGMEEGRNSGRLRTSAPFSRGVCS